MSTEMAEVKGLVTAQDRFDEPVTARGLAQAVARGRHQRPGGGLQATTVRYTPESRAVLIGFSDQSALALPVANYPELAALNANELAQLELGLGGSALCLEARDVHVLIAGLVSASQPLMAMASTVVAAHNGRRSSEAKAVAARSNGQKGGRPRKPALPG